MTQSPATLAVRNPRTGQADHQITVSTREDVAAKAATHRIAIASEHKPTDLPHTSEAPW